jgi:DNA modification methylase/superfamily II DNA or RNA helicase
VRGAYQTFLERKAIVVGDAGREISPEALNHNLFPFQRDLVRWALRKGRSAIFADTGLGKTLMQLAWAEHAAERVLILAPLAVAQQTVHEGERWGIPVTYARAQKKAAPSGITVTNYEMLPHFAPDEFGAVVLDESSILKSFEGKTRTALIKAFSQAPLRLCCTATPAPNDIAELANHAEFLGVISRAEMLATFFVHDDEGWRLKGHAREAFYRWLASWGMSLKRPSDIGYSDEGYDLPPLEINSSILAANHQQAGKLFATDLKGITERTEVRKATAHDRVQMAARLVKHEPAEPWLVWVGLNDEGRELAKLLPDAVLIEGADSVEKKAEALTGFAEGRVRVLITKPSIAGFGMNFQRCARMVFVGLSDSYEQYYQAIRRCWRFGQTRPVRATVVITDLEYPVYENVLRKEREAEETARELVKHVAQYERAEIAHQSAQFTYATREEAGDNWRLLLGDSAERLRELPPASIDLSIFSPPFGSLYTYSATERDLGNCRNDDEFWGHFEFISAELLRVTKPGRHVCVHVAQIPRMKGRDGFIGLKDFRGDTIRHFERTGFIYHGEICIDKDPQAQAIRTKSKALLFTQLRKDASWLRPALADYILIFRVPGENAVAVKPDISNEDWIEWARPIWYGIRESDTLNVTEARSDDDEHHICPLQLGTIERCIRLWSNAGETVCSPFAGIGSEGHEAVRLGRRFIGCELKPEYFSVAVKNLRMAESAKLAPTLFSVAPDAPAECRQVPAGDSLDREDAQTPRGNQEVGNG